MIPLVSGELAEVAMSREGLFGDLPESARAVEPGSAGEVRLREPERDQIALRVVDIDSLIGQEHPARVIWAYVEKLDLSELERAA